MIWNYHAYVIYKINLLFEKNNAVDYKTIKLTYSCLKCNDGKATFKVYAKGWIIYCIELSKIVKLDAI